ncbi:MAG TPA: PQQ-binding-like beta-propeller repeat protein [Candidatus Paceibacterota bacterium]|nr:PQQ-binding-like beta-propeller repeat protein [Candidatus Paceibacterota bacterium]
MSYAKSFIGILGMAMLLTCASAEDWPQWQGPNRNAISKETGLLKEWPEDGPPLAWKITRLGGGDSAPSIAAGRIYGMANRGEDEIVWALSEADGKTVWVSRLGPAFAQRPSQGKEGPGCTPTVDGDRLYVIGLGGDVSCLQVSDGKVIWQKSMTADFGGRVPMWSYRESPLVDGDKVIITPGAPDAMLVALDKLTGKTIWKSQMPGGSDAASAGPGGPPRELGGAPGGARRAGSGEAGSASATVISGNQDPGLFESEHWGMTAFSHKIPNGNYLAKLYFAETYQGITGPGQRVFSFNVHGREFKDFDIWQKAGGLNRAYVETVPVEVTNGELSIAFTAQTQSPAINAIEIIPQATDLTGAELSKGTIRIKAGQSEPFKDSNGQIWLADQGFEGGSFGGRRVFASIGLAPGGSPGVVARVPGGGARGPGRPGGFGGGGGSGAAYSSIIAIDFEGQRQYVQLTARALIGVAASDGKFLWRYDRPANGMGINCSTPIYHDGRVFAASAYNAGGGLVKLSKDGTGGVKAEEVWHSRYMQNHHGGVVLIDGALYGGNGGNGTGYLVCLDFQTGEALWNEGDPDKRRVRKGSMAVADGRIYYRNDTEARGAADEVILIEPSRKEYIERGRFRIPDPSGSHSWSHPVIANGKLYIRDQEVLFCYDVKARGQ